LHTDEHISGLSTLSVNIVPYVRVALSDYNNALCSVASAGFYCYRAIESLVRSFAEINKIEINKDTKSLLWKYFKEAVQVGDDIIYYIKNLSDSERHGAPTAIRGADRERKLNYTKKIIDNYITYCLTNFSNRTK
jgi:hypothetical protein